MAGIAYNRYNLIIRPLAPRMDTALFIIIVWLSSLSIAFLASLSSLRVFVFFTSRRFIDCRIILNSNDGWSLRKLRAIILMIVQYIIPLSCILFLYCKVIKELKRSGLVRKNYQLSTSSNTLDYHFAINQEFATTILNSQQNGLISKSLTEPDIFKITLDEKQPEINNNEYFIVNNNLNDNDLSRSTKKFNLFNLVNLRFKFKKNQKQTINDFAKTQKFIKHQSPDERSGKFVNEKSSNSSKLMSSKRVSNESQASAPLTNNLQSISAKLNLLDDELDRTKRRLTKMMIIVVILFAIAWAPIHTMHLKQFLIESHDDQYCNSSFLYLFFYWIAFSTNTYNPIVYFYFSKELRKDAFFLLKCLFNKIKQLFRLS